MSRQSSPEIDLTAIRPNWSAFVLMVVLLSMLNSLLLLMPLSDNASALLTFVNVALTIVLWIDFFYLLHKSPDKGHFMRAQHGWMVLVGTLPFFRFLRLIWFNLMLRRSGRRLRDFVAHIVIRQSAEGTLLSLLFVTIVILEISLVTIINVEENAPGGNINSLTDAIWWAVVTITTVGYGDYYPVTNAGRVVAIVLMIVGVALISVITGSLAQWFRDRPLTVPMKRDSNGKPAKDDTVAEIKLLIEQQEEAQSQLFADLKAKVAHLEAGIKQNV